MKLYIANKNYSSWSMRPWVLMRNAGIEFEEVFVPFANTQAGDAFLTTMRAVSPVAKVPVLVDGDVRIWDSLAIVEYLAEKFPEKALWPADRAARAHARSICAEMHSGFMSLRQHCCNNIEARLPEIGAIKLRDEAGVRADVARIESMWSELLAKYGGSYLFGSKFSIADAYYAPVVMRFITYSLNQHSDILSYIKTIQSTPGVSHWIADALQEKTFLDWEEPYRMRPA